MNPDEAREEAWRTLGIPKGHIPGALVGGFKEVFDAGWDARGRYDEQRIADLDIPGPEECTCHAAYKDRGLVAPDCAYHEYEDLFKALRALGQSEEVNL